MTVYKVWFDHHEGPYCCQEVAESQEDIEEVYTDDPFFICVEPMDSDFIPQGRLSIKLMSAQALGESL